MEEIIVSDIVLFFVLMSAVFVLGGATFIMQARSGLLSDPSIGARRLLVVAITKFIYGVGAVALLLATIHYAYNGPSGYLVTLFQYRILGAPLYPMLILNGYLVLLIFTVFFTLIDPGQESIWKIIVMWIRYRIMNAKKHS